jgi:hypothetical protein
MAKPIDFDELAALLKQILVDGKSRRPKYGRAPIQRAVIQNEMSPPKSKMREVRWTI